MNIVIGNSVNIHSVETVELRQWKRSLWNCASRNAACGTAPVETQPVELRQWKRSQWNCASRNAASGTVPVETKPVELRQWNRPPPAWHGLVRATIIESHFLYLCFSILMPNEYGSEWGNTNWLSFFYIYSSMYQNKYVTIVRIITFVRKDIRVITKITNNPVNGYCRTSRSIINLLTGEISRKT